MVAEFTAPESIDLIEVHRFRNNPVFVPEDGSSELYWDILRLWQEISVGLSKVFEQYDRVDSVGVDTWGVDYGLLNRSGRLQRNPICYRSSRTQRAVELFDERLSRRDHYSAVGVQFQPFNTVYQLLDDVLSNELTEESVVMLLPDLITYWLCGTQIMEVTNASTTGLLNPVSRKLEAASFRPFSGERFSLEHCLPPLVEAGTIVGVMRSELLPEGYEHGSPKVIAVGSHDTASAVAAVPASEEKPFFISCGTWSLVGVELDEPHVSEDARIENFSNEAGVYGTVRFLKNIMGLWVLNQVVEELNQRAFEHTDLNSLLAAASNLPPSSDVIDINDPDFLSVEGSMIDRVRQAAERQGITVPKSAPEIARTIVDALAEAYARSIAAITSITGAAPGIIHIIGGGSKNQLLCEETARRTGIKVVAGPTEGTAFGNISVQLATLGKMEKSTKALHRLAALNVSTRIFEAAAPANGRRIEEGIKNE